MKKRYEYDIAISFAEEDRNVALAIALALEIAGFNNVFYYPDRRADNWGKMLLASLEEIYTEKARYALVLFSDYYFDEKKEYTGPELNAIKKRIQKHEGYIYMFPIWLHRDISFRNYKELENLQYFLWEYNPKEITKCVKELLGKSIKLTRQYHQQIVINSTNSSFFNKSNISTLTLIQNK